MIFSEYFTNVLEDPPPERLFVDDEKVVEVPVWSRVSRKTDEINIVSGDVYMFTRLVPVEVPVVRSKYADRSFHLNPEGGEKGEKPIVLSIPTLMILIFPTPELPDSRQGAKENRNETIREKIGRV